MALSLALMGGTALAAPIARVDEARATKAALAAVPGATLESAEREREGGRDIWSFDLKTKEGLREVWVDARSGRVVSNSLESKTEQGDEKVVDAAEAAVKARIAGEVLDSKAVRKGSRTLVLVTVKAKDGRVLRATVDSARGKIVKIRPVRKERAEKAEAGEKGEKDGKDDKGEKNERD